MDKRHRGCATNVTCLHDGTLYLCGFDALKGKTVVARKSGDMLVLRAKKDPETYSVRPLSFDGMRTRDEDTIAYFVGESAVGQYFIELPGGEYAISESGDTVYLTSEEIKSFGF
jgi:hypothetical protein